MRSSPILALAATLAIASATDSTTTPCGNLCANGAAPSRYYTTANNQQFAVCDGTDFVGYDLPDGAGTVSDITTAEQLAEICSTTDTCVAGTAHYGFGYLKDHAPLPNGDAVDTAISVFKVMCDGSSSSTSSTTTTTTAPASSSSTTTTTTAPASSSSTTTTTTSTTTSTTTTATTTSTTTKTTTTTPAATTTTTTTPVPTQCPSSNDIVLSGSTYFYKFYSGSCARNTFAYSHYITFPAATSEADATQKCADWIAAKPRDTYPANFQVFQYKPDGLWHCDATKTLNTDSNFKSNGDVNRMLQYNPLPDSCKPTCPPSSQIISSNAGQPKTYSYSLFYSGSCKRNSFAYKNFETYDGNMSADNAIRRCADYTTRQLPNVAQTFQVFYYKPDCKWHCDVSVNANSDSNFVDNKDVKQMFQFNAVKGKCPCKRDQGPTLEKVARKN